MAPRKNVQLGDYDEVHLPTRTPNYPYEVNTPAWPLCGLVKDNGEVRPRFVDQAATCEDCARIWKWIEANRPPEQLEMGL